MRLNIVGAFVRNAPFATELAFKRGFDRLGTHRVTYVDPSIPNQTWDHSADATVVFKTVWDESLDNLQRCGGAKVVYQPDDLRFPHIQQMMVEMRRWCPYALTFDEDGADLAVGYGYDRAKRLLLTADDELYRPLPVQKDIDFIFVGSMGGPESHASRRRMCKALAWSGFKVAVFHDMYDLPALVELYNRSKVVLNHATDVGQPFGTGYGYQCRHFEAGFTKSCVLSNLVLNDCALDDCVATFRDESTLLEQAQRLLDDKALRDDYASRLYAELHTRHMPEHRASEMVDFLGSLP